MIKTYFYLAVYEYGMWNVECGFYDHEDALAEKACYESTGLRTKIVRTIDTVEAQDVANKLNKRA